MFYPWVQAAFIKSRMRLFEKVAGPWATKEPVNPDKLDKDARLGSGSGVVGWIMKALGRS